MTPLDRLMRARAKPERRVVGLLSGTSVDAAEAALCAIAGSGAEVKLQLLSHISLPFPPELRERVLAASTPQELSHLNFLLGEQFAAAGAMAVETAGLRLTDVDLVGSHGQTFAHLPPPTPGVASTLQLGEASVIAERLGVPVVCDFRVRDMAVGGQGAPLVPYLDWALFRKPGVWRAFQNIGGIANVSVVGAALEDTLAFDTGPGNMLLDGLAQRVSDGRLTCDQDGVLSRQGTVDGTLLRSLLEDPFLSRPPPKSTGRETFGSALLERIWPKRPGRTFDLMATAVAFTVEATARAYEQFILPRHALEAVYVSGGGSRHPGLMEGLAKRLSPLELRPLDALGFPEAAKEAACFALLASECLMGVPQNVPSATGATRKVVLGKIVP